jgi:hypothetical protein
MSTSSHLPPFLTQMDETQLSHQVSPPSYQPTSYLFAYLPPPCPSSLPFHLPPFHSIVILKPKFVELLYHHHQAFYVTISFLSFFILLFGILVVIIILMSFLSFFQVSIVVVMHFGFFKREVKQ